MQDKIRIVSEQILANTLRKVLEEHQRVYLDHEQSQEKSEDSILTRNQAADLLQISLPTLHIWTKTGEIPSSRIGGRIYYSKNLLLDIVNRKGVDYG
jgi:excisionase family DNA binding protein